MLDEAGFPDASICASNDLDEYLLHDLKAQGAAINSWGVGTHLITSKDCPSFGGVYKLSAIKNENGEFIPKIKISENTEKITNPGNKTIYRVYEKETGKIKADLICFADETFDESQDLLLFDRWRHGRKQSLQAALIPCVKCLFRSSKTENVFTLPLLSRRLQNIVNRKRLPVGRDKTSLLSTPGLCRFIPEII